jgi:hypothetical protein
VLRRKGIVTLAAGGYNLLMAAPKHTEHCMVCGEGLTYLQVAVERSCVHCGRLDQARVVCPKGHFVCDECHGREVRKIIEVTVMTARTQDPVELAEHMLAHPNLPMLSCDHAFIAAGALLGALRNSPYGSKIGEAEVREVFDRTAKQAYGGFCGLTGVCGVAPALGAVVSIFLGSRCGADREQKLVMEAVLRTQKVIVDLTGPGCCKAYVRAAVAEAAEFFAERFAVVLPLRRSGVVCEHAPKHPHGCREEQCPYYRKPVQDVFASPGFIPGMVSCVT